MYLLIASQFQSDPPPGFDELMNKISACRVRQVRLLCKALTAVIDRDSPGFSVAIQKCVEYQKSRPKPEPKDFSAEDWLPLHANVIYLTGLKLGLDNLNSSDDIAAHLMTPESVGLSG